jgi:hypothetical protein
MVFKNHILKTVVVFLNIAHCPVLFKTHNISETGFCLRLQVDPNQLGPIDRVTPYFWTPAPTQDRIYKVIQI